MFIKTIQAASVAVVISSATQAATVSINSFQDYGFGNFAGTADIPIGSHIKVGTFSIADSAIQTSTKSVLVSSFTEYGSGSMGDGLVADGGPYAGHFILNLSGDSTSVQNQNVFVWVFNGDQSDLSNSTQHAVVKFSELFPEQTATIADISLDLATVPENNIAPSIVVGVVDSGLTTGAGGSPVIKLQTFVPIPEPSSIILLGLGSVALLLRRSR